MGKYYMNKKIKDWMLNAKWYHFWNPGSGFVGGCITGLIIVVTIVTW